MAASNFQLVPGMEIRFNTSRRVSESQSEASSIATELSENDIAARLGLDRELLDNNRFKVDRKKLEEMIQNTSATPFFESLMKDTMTHIYWPSHLKVDAKSKKDVHVKILGKSEDVKIAKERVLEKLDARGSRVTMKMDISYNDHSSIIGTKGYNIKKIMDDTNTHIHFPDSNKESKESKDCTRRFNMPFKSNLNTYSNTEGNHNMNKPFPVKSNQVSLNGTLEGVEKARAAVRLTSPLTISFETPMAGNQNSSFTVECVERVKQTFDVKVLVKQARQKLHCSLVMVKGTEKEARKATQATAILISHMCESYANQTKVCLQMEISTQHHESIKGTNGRNLRQIMDETDTTIIFPDCRDGNTPLSKKSHVTIKGSMDGVYKARQQLIGNLLVTLSFDYSEFIPNTVDIEGLGKKYNVSITLRDKNKQSSKSISIRGKEKFIDKIYEARHELLNLTTPLVKADIPETYFSKSDFNNEFGYQNFLAITSRSNSPLTQHQMAQTLATQIEAFQNMGITHRSPNNARESNTRLRNSFPNFLSPHPTMTTLPGLSPNTSGYNSNHNSGHNSSHNSLNTSSGNGSMDPINHFHNQQSPNLFLDRDLVLADNNNLFDDDKTPTLLDVKNTFNFEQKKIEGYRAMKRVIDGDAIRTPTSTWAGLGLSRTSPFSLETVRKSNDWDRNDASPSVSLNHSPFGLVKTAGIVDATPSNMLLGQHKDIQSLLIHLGLDHYINTFHIHEIDLELFSTLTAENLTTLGIQAFGARKKLLMAIHQLNASKANMGRSTRFSGSAAPGAERRISGDW